MGGWIRFGIAPSAVLLLVFAGCTSPYESPWDDDTTGSAGDDDTAWGDDDTGDDDTGDDDTGDDDTAPPDDQDHDGFSVADGDCDDNNPGVHPGAAEHANGVDDDCDGEIDEDMDTEDHDGDGWSESMGDCDDSNPGIHPGAVENENGVDDDCDGVIDDETLAYDDDGDGFTEYEGDCDDDDPFAHPNMSEIANDGVDNNCDGQIDELFECDCPAASSPARAMDICTGLLTETVTADPLQKQIIDSYGGAIAPRFGCWLFALHTGVMGEDPAQFGADMGHSVNEWDFTGQTANCGAPPPAGYDTKNDKAQLEVQLLVPPGTHSFSVDFQFVSSEYEEWLCTQFNDTFEIYLESTALNPGAFPDHDGDGIPEGNVAFDGTGKPITVNNNYFVVTDCQTMFHITGFTGMGYGLEPGFPPATPCLSNAGFTNDAGSTGWLTTTAPVTPGEVITLRFSIWDEGDGIYDSMVFIDNFQWLTVPINDPETDD